MDMESRVVHLEPSSVVGEPENIARGRRKMVKRMSVYIYGILLSLGLTGTLARRTDSIIYIYGGRAAAEIKLDVIV